MGKGLSLVSRLSEFNDNSAPVEFVTHSYTLTFRE